MPNFIEIGGVTRKPLVDLTRNDPLLTLTLTLTLTVTITLTVTLILSQILTLSQTLIINYNPPNQTVENGPCPEH